MKMKGPCGFEKFLNFKIDFCRLKIQFVKLFSNWFFKNQGQIDRAGVFSRIPSKILSVQPIVFPTLTKNHKISFKKGGDATPYYLDQ